MMSATVAGEDQSAVLPAQGLLYDSSRDVRYVKPKLRGWMHLIAFEASLVIGTLVVVAAHGVLRTVAVSIYVSCVSGLFGASALYHRGNWGVITSRVLQRVDHAMIFLLIAGTATPCFLIGMPGPPGIAATSAVWFLTLILLITHLVWMSAPEKLVGGVFIGLGCLAGSAIPGVWIHGGVAAGTLAIAGGALYIAGAVSYHRRRPDPAPSIFGYHEIFHSYVTAAAACQYVAIFLLR